MIVTPPNRRASTLRVQGAGPMLSCEVIEPSASAADASPIALLCVHGNSSHRGIWRFAVRELHEFRCVLVDLRGHGDSDHVVPAAYDPEDHAADLARVVDPLCPAPYAILAHSAGALAAARFIATVRRRVPIDLPIGFVWVDIDPVVPPWQVRYFRTRVGSVSRVFPAVDDAVRGFRTLYPNTPDERLTAFVAEGLRPIDEGWRMKLDPATYATWEPGDLRPDLPDIACPTLVLRGAQSAGSSAEGLAALRDGLPCCEAREIEGGSHMLLLEHPERIAAMVRVFLDRLAPRP